MEAPARITENGLQRITEEGDVRIVETGADIDAIMQAVADAVAFLRHQGQEPKARVTAETTTVTAFDGTEVHVTMEVVGSAVM